MTHGFRPSMFELSTPDRYATAIEGLELDLDAIVLAPVRATSNAVLEGFEVRASRTQPEALAPDRLKRFVCSTFASYVDELGLQLWIPLPQEADALHALSTDLADWPATTGLPLERLTFVLPVRETLEEDAALTACAHRARAAGAKVALSIAATHAAQASHATPDTARSGGCSFDEVRLTGLRGADEPDAADIQSQVAGLRRQGLLVSATDIRESAQCEQALRSDVDLIQGDFVGFALPLRALAARTAALVGSGATLV